MSSRTNITINGNVDIDPVYLRIIKKVNLYGFFTLD